MDDDDGVRRWVVSKEGDRLTRPQVQVEIVHHVGIGVSARAPDDPPLSPRV